MTFHSKSGIIFVLSLIVLIGFAGAGDGIMIDGKFTDWLPEYLLHQDPAGDGSPGSVDFGKLWVANDTRFLMISLEVGSTIIIQNEPGIMMVLNTDGDLSTGFSAGDIGAELEWDFGNRTGRVSFDGVVYGISQSDIGLITSPSVSSNRFEIALDLQAEPVNGIRLFQADSTGILFRDSEAGGDKIPDSDENLFYTTDDSFIEYADMVFPIYKNSPDHIRVLSYNVLSDGLFDQSRFPSFERIIGALGPDIIGFQEMYTYSAQQTADKINAILPLTGDEQWYASKVEPDIIIVSRYPVTASYTIEGSASSQNNGAFVIDVTSAGGSELLVINAHTPCCSNDAGRQYEIDGIMAFLRDAKQSGGILTLPGETPVIILGDMNLVGYSQQLSTLLTGNILNNAEFGSDFLPDWDNTDLMDLLPYHLNLPVAYTWYNENSSYSPGRLDYIIFSDSVLDPERGFVLFTPSLPGDSLTAWGLQRDDAVNASDHLPVVGDFTIRSPGAVGWHDAGHHPGKPSIGIFPNPGNSTVRIRFSVDEPSKILMDIHTVLGKHVVSLADDRYDTGWHSVSWDGRDRDGRQVASGIYLCTVKTQTGSATSRIVFLR